MELVDIRRSMLLMGADDMKPWKTVILDEDRVTDARANTVAWANFLDISNQTDRSDYVYVALFSNNTYTSYPADMICWTINSAGNNAYPSIRSDWTNVGTSTRSLFANTGTRIDVYKLPKYNG